MPKFSRKMLLASDCRTHTCQHRTFGKCLHWLGNAITVVPMFENIKTLVLNAVEDHKRRLDVISHAPHTTPLPDLGQDLRAASAKILTTSVGNLATPDYRTAAAAVNTNPEKISALNEAQRQFALFFQPLLPDEYYVLVIKGGILAAQTVFAEFMHPSHTDIVDGLKMLSHLE